MRFTHVKNSSPAGRIDLNLLVLFEAVYRLKNLTAAGQELGLSQPAVSRALTRLRERYGDALFVRQQRGVQATPMADHLAAPVAQALALLRGSLQPPGFEPGRAQRPFHLAMSDIAERFFLPRLASHLQSHAPGVAVHSVAVESGELAQRLSVGAVDLALGYLPDLGKQVRTQRLFRERFVYVARPGHPVVQGRITREQLHDLPHVLADPPGTLHAQTVLRMLQRARTRSPVAMRVRSFLSVGPIVAGSDLVAAVPSNLARLVAQPTPLQIVEPPRPIGGFDVVMAWHQRYHRDPGIGWLRGELAALFAGGV
jgi:DNA-binding transcriptional LysR family regulator